jgi:PepSY-associated TM region
MTTIPTEPSRPRAGVGTPDRKRSSAPLWLLARRVHFMAGLLVAPFLAVLALTGLAYAFTPQINDVLYGDKLYVEAQTGSPRPLSPQVEAALAVHPDAHVTSVIPAEDPDRTAQVVLAGIEGLKQTGSHFSSESLTVYVDPFSGGVSGELVTVDNRPPAQVWAARVPRPPAPGRPRSAPFRVRCQLAALHRARSWHGVLGLSGWRSVCSASGRIRRPRRHREHTVAAPCPRERCLRRR